MLQSVGPCFIGASCSVCCSVCCVVVVCCLLRAPETSVQIGSVQCADSRAHVCEIQHGVNAMLPGHAVGEAFFYFHHKWTRAGVYLHRRILEIRAVWVWSLEILVWLIRRLLLVGIGAIRVVGAGVCSRQRCRLVGIVPRVWHRNGRGIAVRTTTRTVATRITNRTSARGQSVVHLALRVVVQRVDRGVDVEGCRRVPVTRFRHKGHVGHPCTFPCLYSVGR